MSGLPNEMASKSLVDIVQDTDNKPTSKSPSSNSSESSSTEEEERLRRLFQTCDRDGDGYIDRFVLDRLAYIHPSCRNTRLFPNCGTP